jgi:hypothetical protein
VEKTLQMMELVQVEKILDEMMELPVEKILEMGEEALVEKMVDNFICNHANYEKILNNYHCFMIVYREWYCLSTDK